MLTFKYISSNFVTSRICFNSVLYSFNLDVLIFFSSFSKLICLFRNLLSNKFISRYGIIFNNFSTTFISPSFFLLFFISNNIISLQYYVFNINKMKSLFVTGLLSFISVFSLLAQDYQEVICLKNGSVIRGTVIEQQPNVLLKVKTADGSIFVYPMNEMEKITKEEAINRESEKSNRIRTDVKGYRGSVEVGTIVNFKASGIPIDKGAFSITTSHGYQFNPYIFLGTGFGLDYHAAGKHLFIPLFVDLCTNFSDTNITPFQGKSRVFDWQ